VTDISSLSLEQKASLTTGASFWQSRQVAHVPAIALTDGPHGVRLQAGSADNLGVGASEPATCFPPAAGLSQAWDRGLTAEVGAALGREARAYGVGVLLGPGVNIKRDPRGGRNFEYFSEDPHLTGELGLSWVQGLQGEGVGASVKHFAANDSEDDRMRSSSDVADRPLREIHLRGFHRIITAGAPWTVMCSYNRINGIHAAVNRWLLTDLLRDEWGFEGAVVSDWGAVIDPVASVRAGVDLAMPGDRPEAVEAVAEAVRDGSLAAADLEAAALNVARLAERGAGVPAGEPIDFDAHHALARRAASSSIVLAKNDDELLPLRREQRVAVIGAFAVAPRYQGGGSSHVNASRVDVPLEEIRRLASEAAVTFAPGFSDDPSDADRLRAEAVESARQAEVAVLFLGLGELDESEGYDRTDLDIPSAQLELLEAVAAVQPRTVVVLSNGGVVLLERVVRSAAAILAGGLLGQAGGGAIADVLYGVVNPSGRFSETVPRRLEDSPAFLSFHGENGRILYGEGIFAGYRWYDARKMDVTFPFGHGLSYTSFAYSDLEVTTGPAGVKATVRVTNTGARAGREVVQFYVGLPDSALLRAPRELKAFDSIELQPGESGLVTVVIPVSELAYWNTPADRWTLESGAYEVHVGASSRDVRLTASVDLLGDEQVAPLTENSTVGEMMSHPVVGPIVAQMFGSAEGMEKLEGLGSEAMRMAASIPLTQAVLMSGGDFTREQLDQLLALANSEPQSAAVEA
jgi:beta-glucosidase